MQRSLSDVKKKKKLFFIVALFLVQAPYLNSFRQLGEGEKNFLSLLFLKNNQPEIILMLKRDIITWQILLPYSGMGKETAVAFEKVNKRIKNDQKSSMENFSLCDPYFLLELIVWVYAFTLNGESGYVLRGKQSVNIGKHLRVNTWRFLSVLILRNLSLCGINIEIIPEYFCIGSQNESMLNKNRIFLL